MRRCLRDFYAVGTPMASSNHLLLDAADRQHQATIQRRVKGRRIG